MERVYYSINESLAKTAHDMMSMRDYEKDSKTKEYRSYVDKAYDLADKIVAERPLQAERLYSMAERYSRRMAEYFNRDSKIGCMCPSILISGGGNFPVKKKKNRCRRGILTTSSIRKRRRFSQRLKAHCTVRTLLNPEIRMRLNVWKKSW